MDKQRGEVDARLKALLNKRVQMLQKIDKKNQQIADLSQRLHMLQNQISSLYAFEKRLSDIVDEIRKQVLIS